MKKQLSALEKFQIIKAHLEEEVCMTTIANLHGLDRVTIRRWIDKYKKQGLAGLERKQRSDKSKFRYVPDDLEKVIEALALKKTTYTY